MATGRTRDGDLVEMRGFQQHVLRLGGHLTIQATHHTGDAEDARAVLAVGRIRDQQVFRAQVVILAVKRGELLTCLGTTHDNRAFNLVQIIGVHRLAQIKHHIVGDIHSERNRAHAGTDQTATHPVRRMRGRVEIMHRTGIIAVAAGDAVNRVVILNRHFNIRRGTSGNTG